MADTTLKLPVQGGLVFELKAIDNGDSTYSLDMSKQHYRHGSLGHYRTAVRFSMATSQAGDSRLFEIRNTAATILVPLRCLVSVLPAGTITASYRGEFSLFRATSFSAVDTTNTVTPTGTVKRTSGMAASPGGAALRHVTVAGAAAGMTGGTLTKDGNAIAKLEAWLATAAATTFPVERELIQHNIGSHPLALAQNEGLVLENTAAGSATANVVSVAVDFEWAEVSAF